MRNLVDFISAVTTVYLVDIKHEDSDMIEVDLYLAVGNEEICVNDDLVRKKYAVRKKQDGKNTTNMYNATYLKKIKFIMLGLCMFIDSIEQPLITAF